MQSFRRRFFVLIRHPHTMLIMTETKKTKKKAKPTLTKHPNLLRQLRERGVVLSMAEVGKLIGCDEATVSRHETGARSMNREQIIAYAKLFRCETHELFMPGEDTPPEPPTAEKYASAL